MEIGRKKRDEQLRKRDDINKWWLKKNRQSPLNLCSTVNTLTWERLTVCLCASERKRGQERESSVVSVTDRVTGTGRQLCPQRLWFLVQLHIQS